MVASSVYYLHEDALGSVRLVATATVTIKFSSNDLPYGSNYAMVGKEVFMYTGKAYDASTGLYYLMARYYDPTIGRFITEDSYAGDDSDPMTMNRYVYARDNPERYSDPDGHMFVVETDQGVEIGRDYLYTPAVMVTNSESERKRNEYVTDTAMTTGVTGLGGSIADYQQIAFGASNPYGGGLGKGIQNGLAGAAGAAVVAGVAIGTVFSLAAIYGVPGVGQALLLGSLAIGAGFALGYVVKNGASSTPTGALNAFEQGVSIIPEGLKAVINQIFPIPPIVPFL